MNKHIHDTPTRAKHPAPRAEGTSPLNAETMEAQAPTQQQLQTQQMQTQQLQRQCFDPTAEEPSPETQARLLRFAAQLPEQQMHRGWLSASRGWVHHWWNKPVVRASFVSATAFAAFALWWGGIDPDPATQRQATSTEAASQSEARRSDTGPSERANDATSAQGKLMLADHKTEPKADPGTTADAANGSTVLDTEEEAMLAAYGDAFGWEESDDEGTIMLAAYDAAFGAY